MALAQQRLDLRSENFNRTHAEQRLEVRSEKANTTLTQQRIKVRSEKANMTLAQQSEDLHNVNLFRIRTSTGKTKPQLKATKNSDFTIQVIINNHVDWMLADTGARISICGTSQARKWYLLK